jgi:hypothetical protein
MKSQAPAVLGLLLGFSGSACGPHVDGEPAPAATNLAECKNSPGTTTLDSETTLAALAVDPGTQQALILNYRLVGVALTGGEPSTIAETTGSGLAVLDGVIYFVGQDGRELHGIPVAGGAEQAVARAGALGAPIIAGSDSIYVRAADGVMRLTPSTGKVTALTLPIGMRYGLALQGEYLYTGGATADIPVDPSVNGVIDRVPIGGGPTTRLVAGVSTVRAIVADDAGLYWTDSAQVYAAQLDGTEQRTLAANTGDSLALVQHRLYFTHGSAIESVAVSGGEAVRIVDGLSDPGMLRASGGNLVWAEPGDPPVLSQPMPVDIMTACATAG